MDATVRALCAAAARPYLAAGRFPYHYAQSKLRFDAVFLTFLRRGLIPDGARVLDLGCGQSLLASILLAARRQFETGAWPRGWPAPPANLLLQGIELQDEIAQCGRIALGDAVRIETGNAAESVLPAADVIVLLDVLHYLDRDAQLRLLENVARTLQGGGRLLVRVADASAGLSFHLTRLGDRLGTLSHLGQHSRFPRMTHRAVGEWTSLLRKLGFQVEVEPIAGRGALANVLLHARISARGKT